MLPLHALDLDPDAVRARLAWARARGHPYYVWPDVAPAEWRGALEPVGAAVAALVRGAERVTLEPVASPAAVGVAAFTSGTGPLLGHWVEAGRLSAPPEVASILLLHLEHGRRRAARLRAAFADVLGLLATEGVRPTLVKGFHTGHSFFPEPAARPVSDVDAVVRRDQVAAVERALKRAGFAARPVLADPYMCEWTPPGEPALPRSLELTHECSPWNLDVHGSFERDFGGTHRVATVPLGVQAAVAWTLDPRADVLRQPYLTAYLAAHASQELKNLTMVRLVELVWVIRAGLADGTLVWRDLRALLERQGAARFVHPALELAERLAPGTVDPELRAWVSAQAPERVRRIVARLEPWSTQRLEAISMEEQLMWVDGPRAWLRRARRALWPEWAGPWPNVLRVQASRLRALVGGRVGVGPRERP